MSAIDHSPLPYHVETHGTTPGNTTIELVDKHGLTVTVLTTCASKDRQKANAAFLARACNAHDPLMAALRKAREYVVYYGKGEDWLNDKDMIDDALANATGQERQEQAAPASAEP